MCFVPEREQQVESTGLQIVGLNYFPTMGLSLLRGRDFTAQDSASAPKVTIINEALAARLFPGEAALGKQLRDPFREGVEYEIVGIAKDSAYRSLGEAPRTVLYRPFAQEYSSTMNLVVRTAGDSAIACHCIAPRSECPGCQSSDAGFAHVARTRSFGADARAYGHGRVERLQPAGFVPGGDWHFTA